MVAYKTFPSGPSECRFPPDVNSCCFKKVKTRRVPLANLLTSLNCHSCRTELLKQNQLTPDPRTQLDTVDRSRSGDGLAPTQSFPSSPRMTFSVLTPPPLFVSRGRCRRVSRSPGYGARSESRSRYRPSDSACLCWVTPKKKNPSN